MRIGTLALGVAGGIGSGHPLFTEAGEGCHLTAAGRSGSIKQAGGEYNAA